MNECETLVTYEALREAATATITFITESYRHKIFENLWPVRNVTIAA